MESSNARIAGDQWQPFLEDTDGHQLIVAGPGSGKTEFLIRRVAHLIQSGKARRDEIAVLTFSRRAATAIRERVDAVLGATGPPIEIATFHSLALRLVETAGRGRPTPLTGPEQVAVVADLLASEDPSDWPLTYRGILAGPGFASEIADFLMRCSERLMSPADLDELTGLRADWAGIPGLFRRYRATLGERGRTDYGTLLVSAVDLLRTDDGQSLAKRYRYVVVDEYQDTSPAQAEMAGLLASAHGNLTVTGDPYQSVYSFRGAEVRNVAEFTVKYPDATRMVLAESFRVPKQILDAALRIVSSGELPGAAGPVSPAGHQGRVETYVFDQETAEAEWIAAEVETAIRTESVAPGQIAILVRSKQEMIKELSRALARRGIPHDPPDSRLVDHPSVQTIADLVTVTVHGGAGTRPDVAITADLAMRRILLGPLVETSLGRERELLRMRRRSWEAWPTVIRENLEGHDELAGLLGDAEWAVSLPAVDGFWKAWSTVPGFDRIALNPDRKDWRKALSSFAQALARQAERDTEVSLARFLDLTEDSGFEPTPLLSHRGSGGRVALTTLHQSKGLEFDIVFIANAVEGIFPDLRRSRRMLRPELLDPARVTDLGAQHLFQIQEEMRLAYTAMTRARKRVVWSATDAGIDQGEHRPSRFLLAAAGARTLQDIGPPAESDRDPVTIAEFETRLRRRVLDPSAVAFSRLAAISVLGEAPGGHWDPNRFAGVSPPGEDQPILEGEVRLSPSQGDAYATCPRRYALERRLRLGSRDTPYLQLGSLLHETLELAEGETIGTGRGHADPERALEIVEQVWMKAEFGTPVLNNAWLRVAEKAIVKLYERWPSSGIPVQLEMEVAAELDGIPWSGKVDRVERVAEGLRVVDYKTGTAPLTVDDAAVSIQLGFYVIAVGEMLSEPVLAAEFWYPRAATQSVATRDFDIDRVDEVRDSMAEIGRGIVGEKWEPRINSRCEKCPFRLSCPAWAGRSGAYVP